MKLKGFSWFLFGYTLFVILWGAWVRISHSGNGCGESWPLCNGEILPNAKQIKTLIEFSHRLTSGLFGILIVVLFFLVRKNFPKNHQQRNLATFCLIFTITEALLGAKLVLFGLVGNDDSFFRLLVMSLHQLNSFLLTGFVFLNAYLLSFQLQPQPFFKTYRLCSIYLLIVMSGAIAALASTLFPTQSLWEGLVNDFAADAHFLLRTRILHPGLAITGSAFFIWQLFKKIDSRQTYEKKIYTQTMVGFFIIVIFGALTLINLSPIWMKLTHLMLAHLIWGLLLRLCAQSLIRRP